MKRSKNWPISAVISIGLMGFGVIGGTSARAKDLGQVGPVYSIVEKTAPKRARQQIHDNEQPTHAGLPPTAAHGEHYLELSYTVPRDITDEKGNVLYPEGYRFNPLEHRRFRAMIVIDGTDPRQLDWAATVEGVNDPMTRIVITKGNKAEVSKHFKRRVYRLHPQVAQRYRITSVPTIIQQKGAALAVTAIPVD
jgi:conjugal transfer pilus assembly protein TraW